MKNLAPLVIASFMLGTIYSALPWVPLAKADEDLIHGCVEKVAEICHLDTHRHIMRYACEKKIDSAKQSPNITGYMDDWFKILKTGCHGHIM